MDEYEKKKACTNGVRGTHPNLNSLPHNHVANNTNIDDDLYWMGGCIGGGWIRECKAACRSPRIRTPYEWSHAQQPWVGQGGSPH
jgi:hypothetical protein